MMVLDKEDGRWPAGVPTPPMPSPRRAAATHRDSGTQTRGHAGLWSQRATRGGRTDPGGVGELLASRPLGLLVSGLAGGAGRFAAGCRGGSECPLVSAPWRLALSVWSLRLLLAHRSHHPRACRVTREALSVQQISSFREKGTRELGGEREHGRTAQKPGCKPKRGRPTGSSGVGCGGVGWEAAHQHDLVRGTSPVMASISCLLECEGRSLSQGNCPAMGQSHSRGSGLRVVWMCGQEPGCIQEDFGAERSHGCRP